MCAEPLFLPQERDASTSVCSVTGPAATSGPQRWRSGEHGPAAAGWALTLTPARSSSPCSITLGGFGADRFYLGQWREGLGKLFSFGGLGIWTLIDVLLIGVGYVGPADGSLYI